MPPSIDRGAIEPIHIRVAAPLLMSFVVLYLFLRHTLHRPPAEPGE